MKLTKTLAISAMATAVALLTIIVPMGASAAGDNNIPYNFNVPGNQNWGYDNNSQYRGTSNTKVPWMVNFTFSGEGITARSEYFILGDGWNYNKYSDYKGVNQGSGAKYFHAYDSAYNVALRIGARNNNYNNKSYTVSGYLDEETALHKFND